MKNFESIITAMALASLGALGASVAGAHAEAQGYVEGEFRVHDRARGELSPGTQAPDLATLRDAIASADQNPTRFATMLEYGERVECISCVPAVQRLLLTSPSRDVRESAAWWLRRRPYARGPVARQMREVLTGDADEVRRQYAAEALGMLMDPNSVEPLADAIERDRAPNVRAAAVRGLARINVGSASHAIAEALADVDPSVQIAALEAVIEVGYFDEMEPLMGLLASDDASIRRRAARAVGLYHVPDALPALAAMLAGDVDRSVRQAAAWAIGRIGGGDARAALDDAEPLQDDDRVLEAIRLARRAARR